jgi:hypothetical protein
MSGGPDQPAQTDPPAREVRWERMFPDELERAFRERPVAYLTYGLCEPHGPQNAVGLDALKAHAIACRAARSYGDVLVGARRSAEVEVDGPPAGHHPRALEPRHLLRHQRDGREAISRHCYPPFSADRGV